jgi:ribokinase
LAEAVVLGDVNVDVIALFASFPNIGEDAFASASSLHCGGSAANTAMGLAQFGIDTELLACVGCDPWALTALQVLESAGVHLESVQRSDGAMTGLMYVIVTPGGERTILGCRGANTWTGPELIRAESLAGTRLLHLSGYALLAEPQRSAALSALALARDYGLAVSLDPGVNTPELGSTVIPSLLPQIDILLPNLAEAQRLTGLKTPEACASFLRGRGVRCVAVKLGAKGCVVGSDVGLEPVPGFEVQAMDTTGAGDAFAAGFLAAFLRGLGWCSAALLGNAMGALTASRVGGGASLPTAAETLEFLQRQADGTWPGTRSESLRQVIDWITTIVDGKEANPL